MSELFLKIVNMSISASWLVIAVLLLRLVLKKTPKWVSVLLWGFVAVRLICPFSFESILSLIPSAETITPEIMTDSTPEIHTGIGSLNNVINPIVSEAFAPDPLVSMNPLQFWIPLAAVAWIAGIAAMLIYTAVSYILLRRKVATAVLLRNNIFQSENVDSPFVLGIIKPKIYLPFQMDGQNLEYVISHEQSHIRRKDHWWKPFGFILLAIHWFNPLMWLGYILLCRDIELACDEKVIKEMDNQAKADYTQALLDCSVNRRSIAACPLAFGEVGVKARVKSVMNYRKPAFWMIVAAIVICIAVAVCFLTNPKDPVSGTLPNIHSHTYVVEEVTYEAGIYDFTVVAGENSPIYAITEDMTLASQKEHEVDVVWTQLGKLEEITLTEENFDNFFLDPGKWVNPESAATVRKNTVNAWRLIYDREILYYVLQHNNGDVYLAYGYCDYSEKDNAYSDDTHISWLYKLGIDTTGSSGMVAKSGDNAVPMLSFPADTVIADYVESVYWLTIDPGEDEMVPFTVWRDGEEVRGFFNAFDAETFAPVGYDVPSGLEPQTNLFQNADPARAYIVLATFSTDEGAEIYAFGARFDSSVSTSGEIDSPQVTYSDVQLLETKSNAQESSYRVGSALPGTDFSSIGPLLADKITREWNTFDSMTREQQLVSSHLWGTIYIETDTWDECEDAIGFTVFNPLESLDWISKTGYIGMESLNPDISLTHVQAIAYATHTTNRELSQIDITSGYNKDGIQITLTASVCADTKTITTGMVTQGFATYSEKNISSGSGIPVLIVTPNESNNTGYFNDDYFDQVAYWVKDNVFYTLRVFGTAENQTEIENTLNKLINAI